ncbi:glycoside hydrolase family 16 protein [Lactarius sanguifluus]|nr:glycoside hydrolase family 16 protein [Lactarius sanguifluus]
MFGISLLCIALYSGSTFFDRWDFYGSWDNLTLGDVWWLDRTSAFQQNLAYIDENNRAVIKVDNVSNVPFNEKRNTVWPAFWTKGPTWPDDGEIDIIEGVNLMGANQYALHTLPGCSQPLGVVQTGVSGATDCSQPSGCIVSETSPNSFNEGFATAGGGVWATQFDVAGIFIWFWTRANLPPSILQANSTSSIDISEWGPPSASYPATTCNIPQYFTAQQLVIDITLCGVWAGLPQVYNPQCLNSGPTGLCYNDNVVGPGSPKYDNAYFEINYVRAYTTGVPGPTPSASAVWIYPNGSSKPVTLPAPTGVFSGPTSTIGTSPNVTGRRMDIDGRLMSLVGFALLGITLDIAFC